MSTIQSTAIPSASTRSIGRVQSPASRALKAARLVRSLACALVGTLLLPQLLAGCTVVAVTTTAVGVTATAVGLAADAAVGTAKVVGKGVGMAVDAMSSDGAAADNSGIQIRESIRPAPGAQSALPALPDPLPQSNPPPLTPRYSAPAGG